MTTASDINALQKKIWDGSIPLEIRLAQADCRTYDESDPYMIQCPRISYLPFLLPRLQAFFSPSLIEPGVSPSDGWFSFEDVALKWPYPLGLLYDIYSGAEPFDIPSNGGQSKAGHGNGNGNGDSYPLPWKLVVHFTQWPEHLVKLDGDGKVLHDAFVNSVKEADFLRNGTAKTVMSLSKDDSTQLWESIQNHSLSPFRAINNKFLNVSGSALRHIPLRIYLPSAAPSADSQSLPETPAAGHIRVLQALVTPTISSSRQAQTLGTALNAIIPSLFPSRRSPVLALPVLHGTVVPLAANVDELVRGAAYADGWLHVVIVMMS